MDKDVFSEHHEVVSGYASGVEGTVRAALASALRAVRSSGGRAADFGVSAVVLKGGDVAERWNAGGAATKRAVLTRHARDVEGARKLIVAAGPQASASGTLVDNDRRRGPAAFAARAITAHRVAGDEWLAMCIWTIGPHPLTGVLRDIVGSFAALAATSVRLEGQLAAARIATREASSAARVDPLTGLGNRRAFDEARQDIVDGLLGDVSVAVVNFDMNGLKALNDGRGHDVGDIALRTLGAVIQHNVRRNDVAVRHGGDEFQLLLPETPDDAVESLVERIRTGFGDKTQEDLGQRMTVSAGVAIAPRPADLDVALELADSAMYKAKRSRSPTIEIIDVASTVIEREAVTYPGLKAPERRVVAPRSR